MKLLERTLFVVCVYSFVLWCFAAATAWNMLMLSFLIFAAFYLLLGFAVFNNIPFTGILSRDSYEYTNVRRVIGGVVAGITMAIMCMGVVFKFLYVIGDTEVVNLAMSSCVVVLLVIFAVLYWRKRKPDSYYKGVIVRIALAFVIGIALMASDKTVLLKTYFRNDPAKADQIILQKSRL